MKIAEICAYYFNGQSPTPSDGDGRRLVNGVDFDLQLLVWVLLAEALRFFELFFYFFRI
jgi:hypothetical protein